MLLTSPLINIRSLLNISNSKSLTKTSPFKVINIRSFKKFHVDQFQANITAAPFHVAHIFDHKDDVLWAWNSLFKEICDFHAPVKRVRIRSQSLPWMDNSFRRKMNLRYKLFKTAICTKDQNIYASYNRVRNEITSELRKAKSRYFNENIASVKSAAAYCNLRENVPEDRVKSRKCGTCLEN